MYITTFYRNSKVPTYYDNAGVTGISFHAVILYRFTWTRLPLVVRGGG